MTTNETTPNYSTLAALDNLHNAYKAVGNAINHLKKVNLLSENLRNDLKTMTYAHTEILWEWVNQFQKLPPQTQSQMPKTGELVEVVETVLAAHGWDPVTPALGIVPLVIENYHRERTNGEPHTKRN